MFSYGVKVCSDYKNIQVMYLKDVSFKLLLLIETVML